MHTGSRQKSVVKPTAGLIFPVRLPQMNKEVDAAIRVIDSHTGGEPTRLVVSGGPDLGVGDVGTRLAILRDKHDWFRSAVVNEPRGSDVLVGALLCAPKKADSAAATIFFNNVGYLGMCGHGSIGLAVSLAHIGQLELGRHTVETPAGDVTLTLHDSNRVSVQNVLSRRDKKGLAIDVPDIGRVTGDVAWGGNGFFLISEHGQDISLQNVESLSRYCWAVRGELERRGVSCGDGQPIDHIELFGPPTDPSVADSKNFVLCPGRAYDRSPCGTGTSAKLACLLEDGKLAPGEIWRQESITGSVFEATAVERTGGILPTIMGSAYVTAESLLLLHPDDPFRFGLV